MLVLHRLVTFLIVGFGVALISTEAKANGAGGVPQPPPQFWSSFNKLATFTSDGKTPVTITLPGEYDAERIIDDAPSTGGPKGDQPLAASIRGPGVLIYSPSTTPPFAGTFPPLHTNNTGYVTQDNTASDWNPAIAAAVAGPYWPAEWPRGAAGNGSGGNVSNLDVVGHVTVKVLPAGVYVAYGQFGTGSIPASVGPTERFPFIFLTSAATTTGSAPAPAVPTVTLSATDSFAVEGGSDNGKLQIVRVGGDTTQPLSVTIEAGVPANTLNSTAFPGTDYTLTYGNNAPNPGSAVTPGATSNGNFTVVIPANALSVRVVLTANQTPPHPQIPVRPAAFKLVASSAYTIGS